jgi:hypothetical protein
VSTRKRPHQRRRLVARQRRLLAPDGDDRDRDDEDDGRGDGDRRGPTSAQLVADGATSYADFGGGGWTQSRARRVARSFAFSMAETSSSLSIFERPSMSSFLAISYRCFLLALASTPPWVSPRP